jgi:2-polyprenyl-3-methyl-5-hydroxy-6-metoxy-1,4-benzoquinol methylase
MNSLLLSNSFSQLLNISHLAMGQAAMRAISMETRGILFFGTPHRSDGSSSVGKITAQSVRAVFPDLIPSVAKAIAQDPALEHINTTFQDFLDKREHEVHIVSFYEKKRFSPSVCC